MGETYYEVLGVSADASEAEITEAYRERVLETHPDRNDDPDAAEQFKRVSDAEAVLTDEGERARYDRLGHDGYLRWGDRFATLDADATGSTNGGTTSSATPGPTGASQRTNGSAGATDDSSAGTSWQRSAAGPWWRGRGRDGSRADGRSHHDRQRRRRERRTSAAGDHWATASHRSSTTSQHSATGGSANRREEPSAAAGAGTADANAASGRSAAHGATERQRRTASGFTVHGWTEDVEFVDDGPLLDRRTIVGVGCIALLYPLLVYSSVTPQFHLLVNITVAGCTLVLVGYLLTLPRLAMATFGVWSLLVPVGLFWLTSIPPLSIDGLLVLAAFWIPFGYAVAVWWALRL